MKNRLFAFLLVAALTGCSATDQPCYTQVPLDHLPKDVIQKIRTGFPAATFDRAEEVTAQTGLGYRVFFHDPDGRYWLESVDPLAVILGVASCFHPTIPLTSQSDQI